MLPAMSTYSMGLRHRVVAAKGTLAEVGRRFGVDRRGLALGNESSVRAGMTRLYGRSMEGSRCVDFAPGGRWETHTMLIQGKP